MAIFTTQRLATTDEIAAEMDRRGAVIERLETNVRHWRDECGKLHAQLAKARADLQAWEITAKRIEEADPVKPVAWRWHFNGNWYFGERPAPQRYPSEPLYAVPPVALNIHQGQETK